MAESIVSLSPPARGVSKRRISMATTLNGAETAAFLVAIRNKIVHGRSSTQSAS
jgi:hypothetical protein